ncbi:ladderlectin-like [Mugil cephalus]|uniref:ladderlectin-like n=1 Tax=Mugil cephalus TaxID=48193 RepID=UPI001FB7DE15|nr:ladderlectin-like [Mugil cephalus]
MASGLQFIVLLCLLGGLWTAADAGICRPTCPSGWSRFGRRCFLFYNARVEWAAAERYCTYHRANLASVHSRNEYAFLRRLVYYRTRSNTPFWVGGTDSQRNGLWLWSDGSRFTKFRLWSRGEPNNSGGREGCMMMNFRGRLVNDMNCRTKVAFVCARRA